MVCPASTLFTRYVLLISRSRHGNGASTLERVCLNDRPRERQSRRQAARRGSLSVPGPTRRIPQRTPGSDTTRWDTIVSLRFSYDIRLRRCFPHRSGGSASGHHPVAERTRGWYLYGGGLTSELAELIKRTFRNVHLLASLKRQELNGQAERRSLRARRMLRAVWRALSSFIATTSDVLLELSGQRDSQSNKSGKDVTHPIP